MAFNEKDRLFLRSLTYQSFYHFVKIIGGYSKQGGDISEYIHRPLCIVAQDHSIKRKQFLLPRNMRKTTAFTKWRATWEYLHNPEIRILIVSENIANASRFLTFIQQQILNNALLRWLYPEFQIVDNFWIRRNRWNQSQMILPRQGIYSEATITCIGVGGAAQSGHYDIILIDDAIGEDAQNSPLILERVFWWFDNVEELLVDIKSSEISIVGTYWFSGDFACYANEKYKYPTWIVPALKYTGKETENTETITWVQNPNVEEWDTNFPEALNDEGKQIFSKEMYYEMMNNPEKELVFWCQHMNMPGRPTLLTKFDMKWLRYCHLAEVADEEVFYMQR